MGLGIIQECRREWMLSHELYSWDEIVELAMEAPEFGSIIDIDYRQFYNRGNMVAKIQGYCRGTGQKVPETVGEISRCVYESMALKYRFAIETLEQIKGEKLDSLNIIGGGIQNKLLNQMASNATGIPVITGPVNGAVLGNILMQAVALGEIQGIDQIRDIVQRSVLTESYEPQNTQVWQDAYGKLLEYQTMIN